MPPPPLPPPPPRIANGSPKSPKTSPRASHTRAPSALTIGNGPAAPVVHKRSKSFGFGTSNPTQSAIVNPTAVSTGSHHILPITEKEGTVSTRYTSYRAVPDLTYNPVLFQSASEAL